MRVQTYAGSADCAVTGSLLRFRKRNSRRISRTAGVIDRLEIIWNNAIIAATELPKHDTS